MHGTVFHGNIFFVHGQQLSKVRPIVSALHGFDQVSVLGHARFVLGLERLQSTVHLGCSWSFGPGPDVQCITAVTVVFAAATFPTTGT
jgi:hypothetical protein